MNQQKENTPTEKPKHKARRGRYTKEIEAARNIDWGWVGLNISNAFEFGTRALAPLGIEDERLCRIITARYIMEYADREAWRLTKEIRDNPPLRDTDAAPADCARALGVSAANIGRWIRTRDEWYGDDSDDADGEAAKQ